MRTPSPTTVAWAMAMTCVTSLSHSYDRFERDTEHWGNKGDRQAG